MSKSAAEERDENSLQMSFIHCAHIFFGVFEFNEQPTSKKIYIAGKLFMFHFSLLLRYK